MTTKNESSTSDAVASGQRPKNALVGKGKDLALKGKDMASKGKNVVVQQGTRILPNKSSKLTGSRLDRNDGLVVRSSCHWDVRISSPKKYMVNGKLVPAFQGMFHVFSKDRRLLVEIRTPNEGAEIEEKELISSKEELKEGEKVLIRTLKHISTPIMADDDNSSDGDQEDDEKKDNNEWKEYRQVTVEGFVVLRTFRKLCEVKIGRGSDTTVHDVTFHSKKEAQHFCTTIQDLGVLDKERADQQLEAFQVSYKHKQQKFFEKEQILKGEIRTLGNEVSSAPDIMDVDHLKLLIEIVSAQNLPYAGTLGMTDTCVVLRLGSKVSYFQSLSLQKGILHLFNIASLLFIRNFSSSSKGTVSHSNHS